MKNNQKVFASIVLIALVIIGGYFAVKSKKPVVLKPASSNEMTDWKTYTNTKYGFEFKYPSDWVLLNDVINLKTPVPRFFLNSPETARQMKLEQQNGKDADLMEIAEDARIIISPRSPNDPYSNMPNNPIYKKIILSGDKIGYLMMFSGGNHNPYSANSANIETEHNGLIYSFDFSNLPDPSSLTDTDNQILSTFKFIDASSPVSSEQKAISTAREVLKVLAAQDYEKLEELVSPDGLSISLYPNFNPANKNIIPKSEISKITQDTKLYLWGYTDGKGDPINLTRAEVLPQSNSVDYLEAPDVAVNKTLGSGNSINSLDKDVDGRTYVAFHFSGFKAEYEGMDWTTIYLVFDTVNGEYKLRGIAHDYWTI